MYQSRVIHAIILHQRFTCFSKTRTSHAPMPWAPGLEHNFDLHVLQVFAPTVLPTLDIFEDFVFNWTLKHVSISLIWNNELSQGPVLLDYKSRIYIFLLNFLWLT